MVVGGGEGGFIVLPLSLSPSLFLPPSQPPSLTCPAATLALGCARLMDTVMMSPMDHTLPVWLMHCTTLAPELSVTCGRGVCVCVQKQG